MCDKANEFYKNGLNFECQRCSFCCGHSPGYVYLSERDLLTLCAHYKIELFYHTWPTPSGKHNYEVDFLLSRSNKLCPIEVKSSGYKAHVSLDEFCKKFSKEILWRYLVYTKDLRKDEETLMVPVYMVPFL